MKAMPKLTSSEVQELAVTLGIGSAFPNLFLLDLLFNEGSGYSSFDSFSDRLNAYVQSEKRLKDDFRAALIDIVIKTLKHYQSEGLLSDADYDHEYERCHNILFPQS